MTRIIAGTAGGRRIATPDGMSTRPTTDRVREALFSSLESRLGGWTDIGFLDLFAGSGANGLEAMSRGAAHATFVEQDRRTADLIRRNARGLGFDAATVVAAPAARALAHLGGTFDAVFIDPPYALADADVADVLRLLVERELLGEDAVVVVERDPRTDEPAWPPGMDGVRRRKHGSTVLWYGRPHA